jgi:hypothetical protein
MDRMKSGLNDDKRQSPEKIIGLSRTANASSWLGTEPLVQLSLTAAVG